MGRYVEQQPVMAYRMPVHAIGHPFESTEKWLLLPLLRLYPLREVPVIPHPLLPAELLAECGAFLGRFNEPGTSHLETQIFCSRLKPRRSPSAAAAPYAEFSDPDHSSTRGCSRLRCSPSCYSRCLNQQGFVRDRAMLPPHRLPSYPCRPTRQLPQYPWRQS